MIQKFVKRFMDAKPAIRAELALAHPEDYDALVKRLIVLLADKENEDDWSERPDPERITVIDHGEYQGTRLYIVGAAGYQPDTYWYIFVNYGSCSGCDTLEGIRCYQDDPPSEEQLSEYWTLMLHMVQSMRELGKTDDAVDPHVGHSSE